MALLLELWHRGALAMIVLLGLLFFFGSSNPSGSTAEIVVRAAVETPSAVNTDCEGAAHLFCDREVRLTIDVFATHPRRIDLRATLVQRGMGLAAPLGGPIRVVTNEEIGPASRSFALRFTTPRVKRASEFEVQFSYRSPGEHAWLPAGRTPLKLYPLDLMQPLRSISEEGSLLVLDPEGLLKSFLRQAAVTFVDLSSSLAETAPPHSSRRNSTKPQSEDAVAIWVMGETHSPQDSRRTLERLFRVAGKVVVLGEVSNGYPKMKLIRARNRARVDVEMPLLASLATDPRSQLAIVEAVLLSVSAEDPILFDLEGGSP